MISKGERLYNGQFAEDFDFEMLFAREPAERNLGTRVCVFVKEQRQPLQQEGSNVSCRPVVLHLRLDLVIFLNDIAKALGTQCYIEVWQELDQ